MAVSTDYRDSRKTAYQEYAIVLDHNACRLPSTVSPISAAPLGVAYVAAALGLGICLGVDFSQVEGKGKGTDLLKTVRGLDPETFAKDVRHECLEGINVEERPKKGDWMVIWGGEEIYPSFEFSILIVHRIFGHRSRCITISQAGRAAC